MLCQTCSALNDDEREYCFRCQAKLLVLSGVTSFEEDEVEEYDEEGDVSLDEHLLERVSGLEEIVKRSAEALRSVVDAVQKHERAIFINQTGLLSVKELLERKNVVSADELVELWESKMGEQMLALEKKQRFTERKDRIMSLFRGERREGFLQYVAEAEAAIDAFDPERGMKALEEGFKLDRDNYELSFFLGEMFFNGGDLDRAKAYLERTLEVLPDHFDAAVFYGVLLHERQDLKGAERWLRRAIQISQESFLPYFSLGAIYARKGKLLRASQNDPDNVNILMPYALLCSHLDMNGEAIAVARRILHERPTEVVAAAAYTTLVEALRAEGNFKEANRALEEMLRDYHSNYAKSIAYYEKAYNLAEMEENLDEALESAQLALRYSPKELKQFPLAALGWVYFKRRDYPNAVDFLSKSADLGPTATNLMHLGMALLESGQKDRARQVFRKAKSFKMKGAGLEEKILEQVRSTTKLIDRLHARRRRATTKNS